VVVVIVVVVVVVAGVVTVVAVVVVAVVVMVVVIVEVVDMVVVLVEVVIVVVVVVVAAFVVALVGVVVAVIVSVAVLVGTAVVVVAVVDVECFCTGVRRSDDAPVVVTTLGIFWLLSFGGASVVVAISAGAGVSGREPPQQFTLPSHSGLNAGQGWPFGAQYLQGLPLSMTSSQYCQSMFGALGRLCKFLSMNQCMRPCTWGLLQT